MTILCPPQLLLIFNLQELPAMATALLRAAGAAYPSAGQRPGRGEVQGSGGPAPHRVRPIQHLLTAVGWPCCRFGAPVESLGRRHPRAPVESSEIKSERNESRTIRVEQAADAHVMRAAGAGTDLTPGVHFCCVVGCERRAKRASEWSAGKVRFAVLVWKASDFFNLIGRPTTRIPVFF